MMKKDGKTRAQRLAAEHKSLEIEVQLLRAQCHALEKKVGSSLPSGSLYPRPEPPGTLADQVRAFHHRFGHPIGCVGPQVPSEERVKFRLQLIAEEFFELLTACEIWPVETLTRADTIDEDVDVLASVMVKNAIRDDLGEIDLPALMDALGDLDYVIEGTRLEFGVDGKPIANEIHRANMDKIPNGFRKPIKPSGWKEPDIEGVLQAQGWMPSDPGHRKSQGQKRKK